MDDKELLELAAKAAGMDSLDALEWKKNPDGTWNNYLDCEGRTWRVWNPLKDDGDALRLAVKLELTIERERYVVHVSKIPTPEQADNDERGEIISSESLGMAALNPFLRTRLAIVRAAAEIGKSMP